MKAAVEGIMVKWERMRQGIERTQNGGRDKAEGQIGMTDEGGRKQGEQSLCRRCLTRDLIGKEEYFRNLHDYIAGLDTDIRAPSELYEGRLLLCRSCNMLFQGMCRSCGCYVELRAAVARNVCPRGRWPAAADSPKEVNSEPFRKSL